MYARQLDDYIVSRRGSVGCRNTGENEAVKQPSGFNRRGDVVNVASRDPPVVVERVVNPYQLLAEVSRGGGHSPESCRTLAGRVGKRHEVLDNQLRIRINAIVGNRIVCEILAGRRVLYRGGEYAPALRFDWILTGENTDTTLPAELFREEEEGLVVSSAVELRNPHRTADVITEVVVAERPLVFAVGVVFGVGLSEAVVWAQASERCGLERVASLEYVVAQELVEPSVEGFGPTSRYYVDHAAGIAPEL